MFGPNHSDMILSKLRSVLSVCSDKDCIPMEVIFIFILISEMWADIGRMPLWLFAVLGHSVITSSPSPEASGGQGGVVMEVLLIQWWPPSPFSSLLLLYMTSLWTDVHSAPASPPHLPLFLPRGRSLIPVVLCVFSYPFSSPLSCFWMKFLIFRAEIIP